MLFKIWVNQLFTAWPTNLLS